MHNDARSDRLRELCMYRSCRVGGISDVREECFPTDLLSGTKSWGRGEGGGEGVEEREEEDGHSGWVGTGGGEAALRVDEVERVGGEADVRCRDYNIPPGLSHYNTLWVYPLLLLLLLNTMHRCVYVCVCVCV